MTTYTFARHNPTGELYVLRLDDHDAITGAGGPLYDAGGDVVAEDDPENYVDAIDEEDNEWAIAQTWIWERTDR